MVLAVAAGNVVLSAATASNAAKTPILMELFTSEGCSSCPPVDKWVQQLDAAQPIPGAQLIVLSEHVDYWDHDGWRDPFSSPALTERQEGYAEILGENEVYTPQLILDGYEDVKPTRMEEVKQSFLRAARTSMIPVQIESTTLAGGEPVFLMGQVSVDGTGQMLGGDVFVAIALDKTETDVLAGENDGKKLTNVAVVRDLVKIGKLKKGERFEQAFRIRLWSGADPGNLRVVAFVQGPGLGRVLGAGMTKEIGRVN